MSEFTDYDTPLPCGCSLKDGRCSAHGYMTRVIRLAVDRIPGAAKDLWALQDGYGEPGFMPSQGWDWSGIRDSTTGAIEAMFRWVAAADRRERAKGLMDEAAGPGGLLERARGVVNAALGHSQ